MSTLDREHPVTRIVVDEGVDEAMVVWAQEDEVVVPIEVVHQDAAARSGRD
jgi:hypothetical protein